MLQQIHSIIIFGLVLYIYPERKSFWMDAVSEQPLALQLPQPALGRCQLNSQVASIGDLLWKTSHFLFNFLLCHSLGKPPKWFLCSCSPFSNQGEFHLTQDIGSFLPRVNPDHTKANGTRVLRSLS